MSLQDVLDGFVPDGPRRSRRHDADYVAMRVAEALGLRHTALVIHDDVIDGDLVRRGSANELSGLTARILDSAA